MRTILLIMIVLGSTCQLHSQIQSQSMTLNGKVIDLEDNKNIDYFNIEIMYFKEVLWMENLHLNCLVKKNTG